MIRFSKKKITFENFLCGIPARDYIRQDTGYEEQIKEAAEMIREVDYVLIGAGAEMSTAAGAKYGGRFFEENFADFQEKYGKNQYMRDMYSAGFYLYPDEESYWGYWSKQAVLGGIDLDVTPLHKVLLEMLSGKKLFVLSTNADGQFVKAGLPEEEIFCTQGDYFRIQCRRGCHQKIYPATTIFRQMDQKLVLLEVGVGFNTPMIIRFPFEKLVREHENICLVRLNLDQAVVPESLGRRAVGIDADIAESIRDIAEEMKR